MNGLYSKIKLDGKQAVEEFKQDLAKTCCEVRYLLFITDLNMPIMGGFQASEEITQLLNTHNKKRLEEGLEPLVTNIVATSAIHEQDSKKMQAFNIKSFIPKPLEY